MSASSPKPFIHWQRWIAIGLIVIGIALVGLFSARAVVSYIRIQQTGLKPGVTDVEAIRGWMTVPYIARHYQVPEEYIFQQIQIPSEGNQKKSLRELNQRYAANQQSAVLTAVQAAVRQYQAEHPTPQEQGHE